MFGSATGTDGCIKTFSICQLSADTSAYILPIWEMDVFLQIQMKHE